MPPLWWWACVLTVWLGLLGVGLTAAAEPAFTLWVDPAAPSPEALVAVRRAWETWMAALDPAATWQWLPGAESARVQIRWVPSLSAPGGRVTLGRTRVGPPGSQVSLVTRDPASGQPLPSEVLYRVALHEFGHVLGLEHSPDPRDVMHATPGTQLEGRLSSGDLAALRQRGEGGGNR